MRSPLRKNSGKFQQQSAPPSGQFFASSVASSGTSRQSKSDSEPFCRCEVVVMMARQPEELLAV
jgi:hypothetical protein